MGAVYAAHDDVLDREVAIKVSNATRPGRGLDERLRARSARARAARTPGHRPGPRRRASWTMAGCST